MAQTNEEASDRQRRQESVGGPNFPGLSTPLHARCLLTTCSSCVVLDWPPQTSSQRAPYCWRHATTTTIHIAPPPRLRSAAPHRHAATTIPLPPNRSTMVSVTFRPLYGGGDDAPLAFLLTIDGTRILLDCGWDDALDPSAVSAALAPIAPSLHLVLLSHADLAHAGALPLLFAAGCTASVLSTLPVHRLAQMVLYDAVLAKCEADPHFSGLDLDAVDACFRLASLPGGLYETLRFFEERVVGGVACVASPAGHSLGGAVWRLSKGPEVLVYAVGVNHRGERHLSKCGLALMGVSLGEAGNSASGGDGGPSAAAAAVVPTMQRRPTALITDAAGAGRALFAVQAGGGGTATPLNASGGDVSAVPAPPSGVKATLVGATTAGTTADTKTGPTAAAALGAPPLTAADRRLLEAIASTLVDGGSVLLPSDTAGRVLELILRLDAGWGSSVTVAGGRSPHAGYVMPLAMFPLVLLNRLAPNTLEFARTMLGEWER